MRKIIVKGKKRLEGEVVISGSKNSALPILAATILIPGESVIFGVPNLMDVTTIIRVLRTLGLRAEYYDPGTVKVWNNHHIRHVAPYELVTKMRASFFVIGPILARSGLAKVPLPGGCAIGSRPVNLHIKGLELMGAKVQMEHGFVIVKAEDGLKGARIYLDHPSVGATETIMMAATLASGETLIENAAQEPEISDLAEFLVKAGARIEGAGTEKIKIEGVKLLADYKRFYKEWAGLEMTDEMAKMDLVMHPVFTYEEQIKLFDTAKGKSQVEQWQGAILDFFTEQGRFKPEEKEKVSKTPYITDKFLKLVKQPIPGA